MATNRQVFSSGSAAGFAPSSGIRDNHSRGSVGEFLREKIRDGSRLSVVSAYFTIYAFDALRAELEKIEGMRFLFGEPRFIGSIDPDRTDKKAFKIEDEGLSLANRLQQKQVARDCAEWISAKAEIRSVRQTNLLHGKMYHIAWNNLEDAILGSSNFTVRGMGLSSTGNNNIELNLEVDSRRDQRDLREWFDELWNDGALAVDVKQEVLRYLSQLYANHAPEFIYFKTLYHVFERFLQAQNAGGLLFQSTQIVETDIWRALFEFQKDGVKGAINKINAHNGCILADSVGLGKTYEAPKESGVDHRMQGTLLRPGSAGATGQQRGYRTRSHQGKARAATSSDPNRRHACGLRSFLFRPEISNAVFDPRRIRGTVQGRTSAGAAS